MNKTIAIIAIGASLAGAGAVSKVSNKPTSEPVETSVEENVESDIVVIQINADWNRSNTRSDLRALRGCDYRFAWLEDQPYELRKTITSVPVVVIYADDRPAYQYVAGISLSLDTPFEEIQNKVYELSE